LREERKKDGKNKRQKTPERPITAIYHLSSLCADRPRLLFQVHLPDGHAPRAASGQWNSRRGDDPGHAQDLLILQVGKHGKRLTARSSAIFIFFRAGFARSSASVNLPGQFFEGPEVRRPGSFPCGRAGPGRDPA